MMPEPIGLFDAPERVELSPAQAAWIEPLRARYEHDERRTEGCEGCDVFGLCIVHSVEGP